MRYKLLVYDLDGTLIDTLPDLHTALVEVFARLGLGPLSRDTVRQAIGDGARNLIRRLVPTSWDDAGVDRALALFHPIYLENCTEASTLYPGAEEFLAARREENPGVRQVILTNKPYRPSERLVAALGLDRWIARVIGGDTLPVRKPAPDGLRLLMEEAGATPAETLIIGDGPADAAVARAAGIECVLLTQGYGDAAEAFGHRPRWSFPHLPELQAAWPLIDGSDRTQPS